MKKRLPKSVRKFIRLQKALIRSRFSDYKKQEELIKELYNKLIKPEIKEINPVRGQGALGGLQKNQTSNGAKEVENKIIKNDKTKIKTANKNPKSRTKPKIKSLIK